MVNIGALIENAMQREVEIEGDGEDDLEHLKPE